MTTPSATRQPWRRLLALPAAAVLAVGLVGCGGSEDSGDSGDSGGGDSSSEASESPAPDESESEDTDGGDASEEGQAYAALAEALFSQQLPQDAETPEQLNEAMQLPEGVLVQEFDREQQVICVADTGDSIALQFLGSEGQMVLLDGECADGSEVSRVLEDPEDPTQATVEGDEELGQPVVDYLTERFAE